MSKQSLSEEKWIEYLLSNDNRAHEYWWVALLTISTDDL